MKTTITKTIALKALAFAFIFLLGNKMTAQCNASFTYTVNANGNVSFQSTSTPTTANCYWTFGNNQTSTLTSPSITYTANGTYTVNLFIWAAPSCSTGITQTINITNVTNTCSLSAGFTYTVGANGNVYFTNTTTGASSITAYSWNINNNWFSWSSTTTSLSSLSNGYHIVCLNVFDSLNNCVDAYCDSILVSNSSCSLSANFSYTMGSNGNVSFASTSTGTGTNTVYSWWINSATYSGPAANYTFNWNGWYQVCLYLSDSTNSCTDSYCDWINVTTATSSSCNANFTYNIGANGSVTLTSTSTGTNSNTFFYWTINNTTNVTGPNAVVTFTNYYNYACLYIYDSTSNCSSSYCDSIIIPSNPCNASVNFTMIQDTTQALTWWAWANYPSNVTNAVWSWGDNTSSTGLYPSHTFSASGFYNICVTITVSCAGTASFCSNSYINRSAEATMPMYHVNVVNAQAPTNIKNYAAKEAMTDLLLYPNPAREQSTLKLNMNTAGDVTLSIYEITGKLMSQGTHNLSEGVNTVDLNTSTLAKGMYLVTINSGNAKKTVRLIKE